MSFGRAFRNLRVTAGWTQQRLADELGVDPTYLSHLEHDTNRAGHDLIRRAAAVLAPEKETVERRLMILAGQLPPGLSAATVTDADFADQVWRLWDTYCAGRAAGRAEEER